VLEGMSEARGKRQEARGSPSPVLALIQLESQRTHLPHQQLLPESRLPAHVFHPVQGLGCDRTPIFHTKYTTCTYTCTCKGPQRRRERRERVSAHGWDGTRWSTSAYHRAAA